MANIVIRKRVTLEFMGDEYKDGYLVFRPITVGSEYDEITTQINKLKDSKDSTAMVKFIRDSVIKRFIEGKFPNLDDEGKLEDVKEEDLSNFDFDTIALVFRRLSGQEPDPKSSTP